MNESYDYEVFGIKTISNLDYYQKTAILNSLNEWFYIKGPPGTGKSLTIANLIANILYKNEKAILLQKKK